MSTSRFESECFRICERVLGRRRAARPAEEDHRVDGALLACIHLGVRLTRHRLTFNHLDSLLWRQKQPRAELAEEEDKKRRAEKEEEVGAGAGSEALTR